MAQAHLSRMKPLARPLGHLQSATIAAVMSVKRDREKTEEDQQVLEKCSGAATPELKVAKLERVKLERGGTDFFEAAEWGRLETIEKFLDKGTDPNSLDPDDDPVLFTASMKGHLGVVQALLVARADPATSNDVGFTALMLSARGGRTETVKKLIAAGADINAKNFQGQTALQLAESEGKGECAALLQV